MSERGARKIQLHPEILPILDELQRWLGLPDHPAVLQKAVQVLAAIQKYGDEFYVVLPGGCLQAIMVKGEAQAGGDER